MPRLKLAARWMVFKARLSLSLFTIRRVLFSYRYRIAKAFTGALMHMGYWLYARMVSYRLRQGMPVIVNGTAFERSTRYPRRNR